MAFSIMCSNKNLIVMNDLIKQVTPLTRAIIWIVKDECHSSLTHYSSIDYLLDGLLTANLNASKNLSSRVIVGSNFNNPLYVMILKELRPSELESFVSLFKEKLGPENDILVLDDAEKFSTLRNELKTVSANIKLLH